MRRIIGAAAAVRTLRVAGERLLFLGFLHRVLLGLVCSGRLFRGFLFLLTDLLFADVVGDAVGVLLTAQSALALLFGLLGAALGGDLLLDGVFLVIDLAVVLRQDAVLHGAEHGLRDPVDGDRGGHGEADPERHDRHHEHHGRVGLVGSLGGVCILFAVGVRGDLVVHLLAEPHGCGLQTGGNDRDQEQADLAPALALPEAERGDAGQVDAEELEVHGLQVGVRRNGQRLELVHIIADVTGGGELSVIAVLAEIFSACLNEGNDGLGNGAGIVHHVRDRLTDDVVKRQQDDERDERPQAAAAHRHALFLVHLLDGQLVFLLVVAVFGLEGFDLRRQTGHFKHALLALDRHRQQHQLDDQREQNQCQTVVVGEGIQPVEQIAERDTDEIGQAGRILRLGCCGLSCCCGLHAHVFVSRADRTGGTAGHGQHEHGGKDPDQDFFLHCVPPNVVGLRVRTTGKNHAALRHRVKIVSLIKGIAPQQPLQRQPAALYRPVFCDRLERILRAGRRKPAPARKTGGDMALIQADKPQKHALHGVSSVSRPSLAASER